MDGRTGDGVVFTLVLLSLFSVSSSLRLQTLTVTSLPSARTLSSPDFQPLDNTFFQSQGDASLTARLLHVDALAFNATPDDLFSLRIRRDSLRAQSLVSRVAAAGGFSGTVVSGLSQGSGEYFARLGVGTPASNLYMVLDTGSDVIWLQCAPCKSCYSQSDPVFDPRKSRTFAGVPCASPICGRLDSRGCNSRRQCLYQVSYGDGSFTSGDLATDTLTFRGATLDRVAIGCGHDNEGLFAGAAGLLGLGRGGLSFPSQTGRRFGGKFSYCLTDRSASSKPSTITFGNGAAPRNVQFTPLLTNPKLNTFYYVELLGISVGGSRVPGVAPALFKVDSTTGDGGVIIDSGTSVTRLTRPAYRALRDAFRAGARGLRRAPDYSLFDTCFDLAGTNTVKVPTLVLHFRGADMALPANNYMIPVDTKGRFCFGFAGTMGGLSIIGNIQQQGFRVVFDLSGSRVGFAPNSC